VFADLMARGTWQGGSRIAFTSGCLTDGHHRLAGVALAGVPLAVVIEAFDRIEAA
jgi:hypothetical protein